MSNNIIAVKGAITVEENTKSAIEEATVEMVKAVLEKNNIDKSDIISAIFTLTADLNAEFPAKPARIHFDWDDVPMLCTQELDVPNSLPKCIRMMITVNSNLTKQEVKHVYLRNAVKLRPDLANN